MRRWLRVHLQVSTSGSSWLSNDGPIAGTVHRLESDRVRWTQLDAMVAANPAIPHALDTIGWFRFHYVSDAAVRIRRLADDSKRSAALGRLIVAVGEEASSLTRVWYLERYRARLANDALWEHWHKETANDWFDKFCAPDSDVVSIERIETDVQHLRDQVAPIKLFVDKRIAHHNPSFDPTLTYEQISKGVDAVGILFRRYLKLIRQVEPLPLSDNTAWGHAFTVPWRAS